jgi:RNA polymerase sigma factor (sigma-70 family)
VPSSRTSHGQNDLEHKFDSLFEVHYLAVHRYCLRRLGPVDSEDAAAEVFAVAWRRLDRVPTGETARAWLLAVAYRIVGNHYRGRTRKARLSNRLVTERPVPSEPGAPDLETRLLYQALDSLRKPDRELLRLSSWDGLSNSEIAAVMGLKQNVIDQRLFRARSRLRERFDDLSQEPLGIKARNAST